MNVYGPSAVFAPFMEELFRRDFCWQSVIDFNEFQRVEVGEWNWKALSLHRPHGATNLLLPRSASACGAPLLQETLLELPDAQE